MTTSSGFTIETDHRLKIIRYKHCGLIQRQELGDAWAQIMGIKEFSESDYNLFTDYRNARFDFSANQTDKIWEFLYSIRHIINGKRESLIADDPMVTAISILFEVQLYEKLGFKIKIFSTEQAALHWLAFP